MAFRASFRKPSSTVFSTSGYNDSPCRKESHVHPGAKYDTRSAHAGRAAGRARNHARAGAGDCAGAANDAGGARSGSVRAASSRALGCTDASEEEGNSNTDTEGTPSPLPLRGGDLPPHLAHPGLACGSKRRHPSSGGSDSAEVHIRDGDSGGSPIAGRRG
jgi:hypothetical protein